MALDDPAITFGQTAAPAVDGELQFAVHGADKPYSYAGDPPPGVPQTRGDTQLRTVRIENARPFADRLNLDVEGFALINRPTVVADLFDEAQLFALGHAEAAEIVREATGASRVVVFDHTIRRRSDATPDRAPGVPRQPASRVHVDQTIKSGPKRVREIMGTQADALLTRRAAIINVWRPIGYAARDWPLVLGDARSIKADDLIATDLIFPHRRGETYGVAYDPAQRYLYIPNVQPDEAILIKCWDSNPNVAALHRIADSPIRRLRPARRRGRA